MWCVFDCARHMVCGVGMYRYSEAEDPWPCANRPKRAAQRLCVCVHVVWWLCSSLWLVKVRELVCVCPRAGIGTWCLRHAWEVHIGGQRHMGGCFGNKTCTHAHEMLQRSKSAFTNSHRGGLCVFASAVSSSTHPGERCSISGGFGRLEV